MKEKILDTIEYMLKGAIPLALAYLLIFEQFSVLFGDTDPSEGYGKVRMGKLIIVMLVKLEGSFLGNVIAIFLAIWSVYFLNKAYKIWSVKQES